MLETERKPTSLKRWMLMGGLVALVAAPEWTAAQGRHTGLVVFGTSLSDPGNAFALAGGTSTPPDYSVNPFLVPDSPYAKGGHHFSNGQTWVEQFASALGIAASAEPAFRGSSPWATNYAVGAARAYNDTVNFNLSLQVEAFLTQFVGVAPSDRHYVIEMGSNDISDAFVVFANNGNGTPIIEAAITSIGGNIQALYAAGARKFLVWRTPNIALTPAIRTLDSFNPGAAALATQVSFEFNAGLDTAVGLLSGLPGIEIERLDVDQTLNDVVGNPAAFGLTNVTTACVTPNNPPFVCHAPDEFMFWDGIHPTTAAHAIIAQTALAVVP